jgi:hypothetical protein
VFPSIDDLRQKFQEAKYIVDEVTLSQVYVAGELNKPVLVEGPPAPSVELLGPTVLDDAPRPLVTLERCARDREA